jgi:hypothetical protein
MEKSYTVVVERDPESTWLVGEEAISVYLKTALPESSSR